MSKPKNMTPEQEEAWRVRKREIAKASYERNREQRCAKVAEYKSKKKKAKPAKEPPHPIGICDCGIAIFKSKRIRTDVCEKCANAWLEKEMEKIRRETERETRSWYKWICKKDLYEKSVRFTGDISTEEFIYFFRDRMVMEMKFRVSKTKGLSSGPMAGLELPAKYFIDGYYRLRTENAYYYPYCGKAGIPHRKLSGAAKDFEEWQNKGIIHGRRMAHIAKLKKPKIKTPQQLVQKLQKDNAATKAEIKMRMREAEKRMRIPLKRGLSFFQMHAACQSISTYAKTLTEPNQ